MNQIHALHGANGRANGNGHGERSQVGVNLVQTKFLFLTLMHDDASSRAAVKAAGSTVARGFFNDFDANGRRETKTLETIQLLVSDEPATCREGIRSATFVCQISAKYRERLDEVEQELARRLPGRRHDPRPGRSAPGPALHERGPARQGLPACGQPPDRREDAERHHPADEQDRGVVGDEHARAAPVLLPAHRRKKGNRAKGHALAADEGVSTIYRRLYHNPDGYQRPHEWDFLTYFECEDRHLPVYDRITAALRDVNQNPEWRFVKEGPEWRGRRVLRW